MKDTIYYEIKITHSNIYSEIKENPGYCTMGRVV